MRTDLVLFLCRSINNGKHLFLSHMDLFLFIVFLSFNISCFCFSAPSSFIIAQCDGGLSNRLRSLVAHMHIAKLLHNHAHLLMIWDINDACPGHFLQIFQPLANVTFISNSSKHMFENKAEKVYHNSREGFDNTMSINGIKISKKARWSAQLTYYESLKWIKEIDQRVEDYVVKNSVCNISSMHIRKTDMDLDLNARQRMGYRNYFNFVEGKEKIRVAEEEAVYLMTDNPTTQRLFQDKYGLDKIKVYANISAPESDASDPLNDITHGAVDQGVRKRLAVDHRFTTLEHTITDVLIAAHSRHLHPTLFSSVSELVKMFQFIHRPTWCGCGFRGC